jgi:hypothetical protein
MKDRCKHQYDHSHPNFVQCKYCDKIIPILRIQSMSKEEFAKLFPSLTREVGPIIINELKP